MAMISMVVGGTTDSSARFVAKVDTGPVRIVYSVNADMSSPSFSSSTAVDAQGVAKVEVAGLTAGTQYFWQVEDNSTIDTSTTGTFRTHPALGDPASFTFAASSCAGEVAGSFTMDDVSNHPVFDTIRTHPLAPLFFVHCGDLHYRNISTDTISDFRQAYDDVLSASRQHQLYRTVPWVYVWDDHDFGPNNSDGTSASAPAAQGAYRERVPHYDLDDSDAIYQSFAVGRVLFICSDSRSARSPNSDTDGPSKTLLGSAQKAWMEALLDDPGFDAQWLVWVNPSVWRGSDVDTWGSFATERAEMVQMLGDYGWLDKMCIVSGDVHGLAMDSGANNTFGGFPVYHFGSLDSSPTDSGATYDLIRRPGRGQYGTVQVDDNGSQIAVTATGWYGTRPLAWHTTTVSPGRRRGPKPVVIAL